jgi:hypothetical protein
MSCIRSACPGLMLFFGGSSPSRGPPSQRRPCRPRQACMPHRQRELRPLRSRPRGESLGPSRQRAHPPGRRVRPQPSFLRAASCARFSDFGSLAGVACPCAASRASRASRQSHHRVGKLSSSAQRARARELTKWTRGDLHLPQLRVHGGGINLRARNSSPISLATVVLPVPGFPVKIICIVLAPSTGRPIFRLSSEIVIFARRLLRDDAGFGDDSVPGEHLGHCSLGFRV